MNSETVYAYAVHVVCVCKLVYKKSSRCYDRVLWYAFVVARLYGGGVQIMSLRLYMYVCCVCVCVIITACN